MNIMHKMYKRTVTIIICLCLISAAGIKGADNMSIADIVQSIRTAIYGKDVRESIASGIEAINTDVENAVSTANSAVNTIQTAVQEANTATTNANNAANVASQAATAANNAKVAYDAATHENTVVELTDARHDNITNTDYANIGARMDVFSSHLSDIVTDSDGVHGLKIEEGLWTPDIKSDGGTYNNTYSAQYGKYYRIGNKVSIMGIVTMSAKDAGMTGGIDIRGLPFLPLFNDCNYKVKVSIVTANVNIPIPVATLNPNDSNVRIEQMNINGAISTPTVAVLGDTSSFYISAEYITCA